PFKQERSASPVPSCVSMKSDWSMGKPINFREGDLSTEQRNQQERSESEILSGHSSRSHQTDLASIFSLLEKNIMTFVKNELKMFKRILNPELPEGFENPKQDKEVVDAEDEKQESSAREGALKITLHVLRKMNQKELADTLEKWKIRENPSPERCINLFHCLNELNDHSLVEEIQSYLRSGSLSKPNLSPAQWSALVFVLLTSEKELDVFDLKEYSRSEEGLLRLLPVFKASRVVLLSGCGVTEEGCASLVSALRSNPSHNPSHLRELDLSNNDLKDSGVKLLSAGLGNPHCKLETLRLSGCLVTEEGCASLVSALRSNPSHLRELDLSYNHPGDSGVRLLSAGLEDPQCRLEKLKYEEGLCQCSYQTCLTYQAS
ncbi:NACHT, LRR and PYD domains-containing protein 3-like, partial [Salvelinus sp. IW2-2015]|uniref:NACHT, LRR and PYD domains-containing protein 3-like n=1 Tax=Salvelinus sp. IW2-2015 TaxID=2691554 RepID=UPI0038D4F16F